MVLLELLLGLAFLSIALVLLFKIFLPVLQSWFKPKKEVIGDVDSLIDESENIISQRDKVKKKVEKSSEKLNTIKDKLNGN